MTQPAEYDAPDFEDSSSSSTAVAEQPDPLRDLRRKPVVVTGAAGLVGTHTCHRLVNAGWSVRAIVRDTGKAARRLGHLKLEIRTGDVRNVSDMRAALSGAGAIVHLAAIAIEKPGERYADTNTDATRVLIDSAIAEGVDRFVYMSQNGADARSPYEFLRSKGVAQDMVQGSSLKWTVLRPSVIFGPEDEFVNVLARLVRLSPLVYPLPGGGKARFQPIAVDDVAQVVAASLAEPDTIGQAYALGGPAQLTMRQMVERVLVAMDAKRLLVALPTALLRPLIAVAQRILPSPPVTTELLDLLKIDNVVEGNALRDVFRIMPTPF